MATHRLALIIQSPSNHDQFLLLKQSRPPEFHDEEYGSFVDSDLWALPSAQLNPLRAESEPSVEGSHSQSEDVDLRKFDIRSPLNGVFGQLGFGAVEGGGWKFHKYVKEAAFGPDLPVNTVFIVGKLAAAEDKDFQVYSYFQEYAPGNIIIPMGSRTLKLFHTTNLVVFAPENVPNDSEENNFIVRGDALIVDPGCLSESHGEDFSIQKFKNTCGLHFLSRWIWAYGSGSLSHQIGKSSFLIAGVLAGIAVLYCQRKFK